MILLLLLPLKTLSIAKLPEFNYNVSEVKNERNCNASYIFSALSAFESAYAIQENSGNIINFSEQYVLSNLPDSPCSGGNVSDVLNFLIENGTYYEPVYPYYGQPIDLTSKPYPNFKLTSFKRLNITNSTGFFKENQYQSLIVRLSYDFDYFLDYTGWDYNCTPVTKSYHYMLAVYSKEAENEGFVYLKNNWGVGWGIKGYLKLNISSDRVLGPCDLYAEVYSVSFNETACNLLKIMT